MTPRSLLGWCLLTVALGTAPAADRTEVVAKQKEAAAANLKTAGLKAAHIETDDLLVYATVPDERAKPLAVAMQKTYAVAAKALQAEPGEKLWSGKLTAYVITDQKQYRNYVLQVLKRPTVKGEAFLLDVRADPPFILDGMDPAGKTADGQVTADATALIGAGLLMRQAETGIEHVPDWFAVGFGRAAYLRIDGNANRLASHRSRVKGLYSRTGGAAFKLEWLTEGKAGADTDLLGTSLAEFLAFGPNAAKFPAVVGGFKPSDGTPMPTVQTALAAAGWTPEAAEAAWQKWVATGK